MERSMIFKKLLILACLICGSTNFINCMPGQACSFLNYYQRSQDFKIALDATAAEFEQNKESKEPVDVTKIENRLNRLKFGIVIWQELIKIQGQNIICDKLLIYLFEQFYMFYTDNTQYVNQIALDLIKVNPGYEKNIKELMKKLNGGAYWSNMCTELSLLAFFHVTTLSIMILLITKFAD